MSHEIQHIKEKTFSELQAFINSADFYKLQKSKPKRAEQIKNIKLVDLVVGDFATANIINGYFKGNVRSEGFKNDGDTEFTRTLNFDYTVDNIAFIGDGTTADIDELYVAADLLDMCIFDLGEAIYANLEQLGSEIYTQDQSELAQIRNLIPICRREHQKLGFTALPGKIKILESEFTEKGEVEFEMCPVYANITDNKGKVNKLFIGYYVYSAEIEKDVIIINPEDLSGKRKSRRGKNAGGFSVGKLVKWLIIAGAVIGAVIGISTCF